MQIFGLLGTKAILILESLMSDLLRGILDKTALIEKIKQSLGFASELIGHIAIFLLVKVPLCCGY